MSKKSKKTPLVKKSSKVKKTPKAQTQSKAISNKTKPIVLAGGVAPEGIYKITDGHYRLEKTLIVGPQTHLAIKNAIIDFAPGVMIDLNGEDVVISDCEFNGEALDDKELVAAPFFSAKATSTFENCTFNGASYRAAIHSSASIKIKHCKFANLIGDKTIGENTHAILESSQDGTIECVSAQWRDCVAPSITGFLISAGHIKVVACDFINSTVGGFFKTSRAAIYWLEVFACLFDNCLCNFKLTDYSIIMGGVISPHLHDNCLINCRGSFLGVQEDASLEELRGAREEIKNGEYIWI